MFEITVYLLLYGFVMIIDIELEKICYIEGG